MTRPLHVQTCLRPFTPQEVQERQQEVLDRLAILESDGIVKAEVVWWSPRVAPPKSDGPLSAGCPDVVCELVDLAKRDGFSLAPFIEEHAGRTPGKGDSLTLPVIALVVRDGEDIGGLYPVTFEGTKYTVEDGLVALESGTPALNLRAESGPSSSGI
jgi:hypothetical protein